MNYLFVYNNLQTGFDPSLVHQVITSVTGISDWWHYLPNVYIINTTASARQISNFISKSLPGLLFFVTKIDTQEVNGVLNRDAWEWINKYNRREISLKALNELLFPGLPSKPPLLPGSVSRRKASEPPIKTLSDLLNLSGKSKK